MEHLAILRFALNLNFYGTVDEYVVHLQKIISWFQMVLQRCEEKITHSRDPMAQ